MANVDGLDWRRSPYGDSADGVEVAITDSQIYLRSSASPEGPWLTFSRAEWAAFLRGLKEPPDSAG